MLSSFLIGLAAGVAATPHCLGMCGGFPLYLARSSNRAQTLRRHLLFVGGKGFTYVFLGTLASATGAVLFKIPSLVSIAPFLRLAIGLITVLFGLSMIGLRIPQLRRLHDQSSGKFIGDTFGGLLSDPSPQAALVLGLGVGFLPCPLPMGMLAAAVASHHVLTGISLMAGVGLGTAPGLLGVGLFGAGLNKKFAKIGMCAAGVVVLAVGGLTITRAASAISTRHATGQTIPSCCTEEKGSP